MDIRSDFFLQTLVQVSSKSNLNIDNLPSLSALLFQAARLSPDGRLGRAQFVQIGEKFCGLGREDADLLFSLYCASAGAWGWDGAAAQRAKNSKNSQSEQNPQSAQISGYKSLPPPEMTAEPRELVVFLFACLFKPTVSSRRQKILQNDLWPQKVQTFESMIEQYVRTCSDVLCASLAVTAPGEDVDVAKLHLDAAGVHALKLLFSDFPGSGAGRGMGVQNSSQNTKDAENARGVASVDPAAPVLELSA